MWAKVEKLLKALIGPVFGAYCVTVYFSWTIHPQVPEIERTEDLLFWSLCFLAMFSGPRQKPGDLQEASPAFSAVLVIGLTGGIGTVLLARYAKAPGDLLIPGLLLAATIVTALLIRRFAMRNAGEIGEARFDTMPKG